MIASNNPKIVLVTGAAQRLGLAIATQISKMGHHVILHASGSIAHAKDAAAQLRAEGLSASFIQADLLVAVEVAELIARAQDLVGQPVTGLVNNASIFEHDAATDFTRTRWDRHFDIHVRVPCELARNLALALPVGLTGSIVNVIDQRVFKLTPQFFSYTLSKAALAIATHTLAQALAPHVRVNGVAPGPTARNIRQTEVDFHKQIKATLLGSGSPVSAVVEAICWMLDAQAVTGQVLAVDGGQSLIWRTPDVDGVTE
ncbi:SDR family oxidoreductase [Candidatus Phycosocius spiralis]|uniref:Short chain dehydrogenase n=1 Tax=Candidatus Phycosocius spiralis TaxID=2815099 RepID=A0ABQ4PWR5_9PROT|nr:SDR family oxidoreductase [Candidatus Phycosocius spiralis]GIU67496.1 short chain dehydrogenase [Candidatus Phycosocius spiralis]